MFLLFKVFVLVMGGCLLTNYPLCTAEEYYVTPTDPPNPACHSGKPCYTLNHYAKNSSYLFSGKNEVILLFLDGIHDLSEQSLEISDTVSLTMAGVNVSHILENPQIHIFNGMNIGIGDISFFVVEHLTVFADNEDIDVYNVLVYGVQRFIQYFVVATNCTFEIEETTGVYIHDSTFHYVTINIINSRIDGATKNPGYFRNAINLNIEGSRLNNSSVWVLLTENNYLESSSSFNCLINQTIIIGNQILYFVSVTLPVHMSLLILNSSISNSLYGLVAGYEPSNSQLDPADKTSSLYLKIEDSTITGIAESAAVKIGVIGGSANIIVNNCTLTFAQHGFFAEFTDARVSLSIQDSFFGNLSTLDLSSDTTDRESMILLKNVTFLKNIAKTPIVSLVRFTNITIDSCYFEGNVGYPSSLVAYETHIIFKGNTTFMNNVGTRGGAIYMAFINIYLEHGTNITFINNKALEVGGALYAVDLPKLQSQQLPCLYQLTYNTNQTRNTSVQFVNNSARNGGDHIYGISLKDDCTVTPDGHTESYEIQNELFQFVDKSGQSMSRVASDPKRICLCDENGKPKCANFSYIVQERRYTSGEVFSLNVVVVGDDFGTVTGGVYATLGISDSNSSLGDGQYLQRIDSTVCTKVHFSVHSRNKTEYLFLVSGPDAVVSLEADNTNMEEFFNDINGSIVYTYDVVNQIENDLAITPILINITILPCPIGFDLHVESLTCQCCEALVSNDVDHCTVVGGVGLVYRNGTTWVSHSGDDDNCTTDGVLVDKYCPYDYCKTEDIAVDLYYPDIQCAFNHTGILCGGCPSNLSLALGSPQCLSCSDDWHIALLVVFIVAGIGLVCLIMILDLTVSRGTINGLVLYANVIWINQSIFFRPGEVNTNTAPLQFMKALKVFIAWLNLDFGIETCFYHGLDAYWKTWLQFVFPLYIWMIAVMIIVVCHYSPKATKIFGNNIVRVLATLFLLSYVKLLRTIVTALGFSVLQYPEGPKTVWLFDGNVAYFGVRHSLLFVFAVLALVILWLPYTLSLLFVPCLKRKSDHYLLHWINKWKPFYDAYYGPLKDKHHYWIGVTLLVRVVLAVIAVAIQATAPEINVLLIAVSSSLLCLLVSRVYKMIYVSALEASFLINLIILCGAFPYTRNDESRITLICTSVGVSFLTFLGILVLHGYIKIKNYCRNNRPNRDEYENLDQPRRVQNVTRSFVSINDLLTASDQLREPLLESDV